MKRTRLVSLALSLVPAAVMAQASGQAQASSAVTAKAPGTEVAATAQTAARADAHFAAPKGWSAEGAAKLEAMYGEAKEHDVPREPIARRVAEGSAKGSAEASILASAGRVTANLKATHDAMVTAGRKHPSDQETERGASLMERGVTSAQIETLARHSPNDRSLVVAFEVLGRLTARGVPVTNALAQVQGKLDAHVSDAAIIALAGNGSASGGTSSMAGGTAAAGGGSQAGAGASVTGAATGTTKGITVGATGAVGGIVKKQP